MSCHLIKECCTRDGSRSTEVAVQAEASNHLALGRRIEKRYKKTITKWLWDGNKPLHEWKVFDFKETTPDDLITWIFEEDSFAPAAKIKGDKKYSLVCDHLGTPTQGYNEEGALIWERQLDSYGKIKMLQGDEGFCNYLYQGQTLDAETGLAYNRFRYYDPEEGVYISQDPIGLAGGIALYGYVEDINGKIDPWGLNASYVHPSKHYSVWHEALMKKGTDYPGRSRGYHNAVGNKSLYEALKADHHFAAQMEKKYPGITNKVSPGERGGFSRDKPHKDLTWHHYANDPSKLQLVPSEQHGSAGIVQSSLHPNKMGGFKLGGI